MQHNLTPEELPDLTIDKAAVGNLSMTVNRFISTRIINWFASVLKHWAMFPRLNYPGRGKSCFSIRPSSTAVS
jgi:hypothetical protein